METQKTPIQLACDAVGSQAELARLTGLSPSYVNQMVKGIRPVPVEYCVAIEKASKGVVTRRDLCDDWQRIWPLKDSAAKAKNKVIVSTVVDRPTANAFAWMGKSQAMAGVKTKSIKQIKQDAVRENPESSLGYATRETNSFKAPR